MSFQVRLSVFAKRKTGVCAYLVIHILSAV